MSSRFTISTATVVMLVLLRLNIGWHFFSEGVKHYADPKWTSEPLLRNAKGPLAPLYQSYLPDFHGFERLLHDDPTPTPEHAVGAWVDEIQQDWDGFRQELSLHHGLDEAGQQQATRILQDYQAQLRDWAAANKEALATHVHQWRRQQQHGAAPDGNLPFERKRQSEQRVELLGEAGGWLADLKSLEREYRDDLDALAPDRPPMPRSVTSIDAVDATMTYVILAIGLLLLVGLLTRTACLAGAVFLCSVVMMQPFWVSETQPTFNQYVEMFALLTLATTHVGRWAGLDFFLAGRCCRPCCSMKGKTDASES